MGFLLDDQEAAQGGIGPYIPRSPFGPVAPPNIDAIRQGLNTQLPNPLAGSVVGGVGVTPHPLAHIGDLIGDHAQLLRNRLLAAHLNEGLAPPEIPQELLHQTRDPLDLVNRTRGPGQINLAAILDKFHSNTGRKRF